MNIMSVLHSKKVFSDVLDSVNPKISSLAMLAGLIPSFFCMASTLNILNCISEKKHMVF